MSTGLHPLDYLIVFFYMAGMLGVGAFLARKQETIEEFFVAGRKMPWLAAGLSMIATLMSTLSYLGTPGEMIKHGIAQTTAQLAAPVVFVIVGFVFVPFFMRLRLTSAYEFIERRFGSSARLLTVVLYLYMRFLWMGAIVFTASTAVAEITRSSAPGAISTLTGGLVEFSDRGWFYFVLIATGIVSTLYTMLGGLAAVIWTDVIQFVVLFLGAIATLVIVAVRTETGPVTWLREATSVAHEFPPIASWDITERNTILWAVLAGLIWNLCTHCSDQVALQRYFSTPSAQAARRTALVNYIADLSMQLLLSLVGAALLVYYVRFANELPEGVDKPTAEGFTDKIFPHFIAYGMPIGLSGLLVAAVFAVAQSSIDSGINSTTTVITIDLVRRYRRVPLGNDAELRLARWLTLAIGTFVTSSALLIGFLPPQYNIVDLQMKSFNCVLGSLGAIFMSGIFLRHVSQPAVCIAGVAGAISGFTFGFMDLIPGVRGPSAYLVIPLSWLVTIVLAALLGFCFPAPNPKQLEGLTFWDTLK